MSGRRGARCVTFVLTGAFMLATACVHRTATNQDFGLPGLSPRKTTVRSILRQQAAFNPLADDERVQSLRARLKVNPADAAARLELAVVYENYRLYDDALEQYAESLRNGGAEPAALGLARCARASGRTNEAVPILEAFLKQSPTADSWHELGLLFDELGDVTSGEHAFHEALERNAESDRLHNSLGQNLLLQNKSERAESEFRKALELNPASAIARNNLGILLARRGDLEGALEQFQMTADAATAHNNLAVVLFEKGDYEKSREELVKALAIRQSFGPALTNFKLVQERIRARADLSNTGNLPLNAVHIPSAMELQKWRSMIPTVVSPDSQRAAQLKDQKERR